MSKLKVTVWVAPIGFGPIPKYKVVKAQNTLQPAIGDILDQETTQKLIDDGVIVNVQENK